MKKTLSVLLLVLVVNAWATGTDESDDDYAIQPDIGARVRENRFQTVSKHPCLWVTGYVKCPDQYNEHDGRHVVIRFVDDIHGKMDEGYSSKNGYFRVFGCSQDSFKDANPEIHILHNCKNEDSRLIKIPLPHSVHNDLNFTNVINLDSFYIGDDKYERNVDFPCDPF